jgi:NADPH:quinone reductase-like Zn-dependent oxidoreductase
VYFLLSDGELQPLIDSTLPLERAAEAHERLAQRKQFGKIVLLP